MKIYTKNKENKLLSSKIYTNAFLFKKIYVAADLQQGTKLHACKLVIIGIFVETISKI